MEKTNDALYAWREDCMQFLPLIKATTTARDQGLTSIRSGPIAGTRYFQLSAPTMCRASQVRAEILPTRKSLPVAMIKTS